MNRCPNISSPEAKELINKIGIFEFFKEYRKNNYEIPDAKNYQSTFKGVNSSLKVVDALSKPKTLELFNRFYLKGNKDKFFQEITGLAGKEQVKLLRDWESNNPVATIDDMISGILSEMSFTVEIDVTKDFISQPDDNLNVPFFYEDYEYDITFGKYGRYDDKGKFEEIGKDEYFRIRQEALGSKPVEYNTQYYSNLTVPGGTNYTENEIRTPEIIPSIKGHAQFSTDNGIGWFRSDESTSDLEIPEDILRAMNEYTQEEYDAGNIDEDEYNDRMVNQKQHYFDSDEFDNKASSKTRRVLELQSDLFQKGRDRDVIAETKNYKQGDRFTTDKGEYEILSRIAYVPNTPGEGIKEYFKLKNLTTGQIGETTVENFQKRMLVVDGIDSKNKFLQLLNKDNNWVSFFVKSIIQDSLRKGYKKVLFPAGETAARIEGHQTLANDLEKLTSEQDKYKDALSNPDNYYYKEVQGYQVPDTEVGHGDKGAFVSILESKVAELETKKQNIKSQGIEKLKPIEGFYEVRVQNILKKNYPISRITDDYGNEWFEVNIDEARDNSTVLASEARELSEDMKNLFGDRTSITVGEALETTSNNSDPRYGYSKILARRLLRNLSNDTTVELVENEELQKLHDNNFEVGGLYRSKDNKIYVRKDQPIEVVIHEILHAFTVQQLRSNSQAKEDLEDIFLFLKRKHPELKSEYSMSNLDEFLTGIFTDREFIEKLSSIPAQFKDKANVWEELLDVLARLLSKIGFSQRKSLSIIEESMDAAIRVIEDAKEEYSVAEAQYEGEEVFASKAEEDADFIKSLNAESKKESKILLDIRERLTNVQKILRNKIKNEETKSALEKLAKLKDKIEELDEIQAIQEYIVSAAEIIPEYMRIMEAIKSEPNNTENIDLLVFIHQFLGTFSNLSSIQNQMMEEGLSKEEKKKVKEWKALRDIAISQGREGEFLDSKAGQKPVKTTRLLDKAVKQLRKIEKDYIKHGIDLQAQVLFGEYSQKDIATKKKLKESLLKKNPKDAYALSLATTWQELAEQMRESTRDIDSWERWTASAFGGSTNDFIALVAKRIENQQTENIERLRIYEERLGTAHEEYAKASGKNKNDVESFNEPFIEIVTTIVDGKEIKTKEFIGEFDMQKYSNDLTTFEHKFKSLKESNYSAYMKQLDQWHRGSSKVKDNVEAIIQARKESMSEYEFEQWKKRNINEYNGKITYKGELLEPNDSYRSQKYKNLQKDAAAFKYYTVLKDTMEELKLLLPKHKAEQMGNRIPSVYKGDWEFGIKNIGKIVKDKIKLNQGDTQYGLVDLAGNIHKELPTHFVAKMDADITSDDLLQSVLKAAKSWITYDSKVKILSEIQLIEDIAKYDPEGFKVAKTTISGENKINPTSLVDSYLKKEGATNLQSRLDEIIKDLYYGMEEEAASVQLFGKEMSLDKLTSNALKATSIIQLSGSWISGSVNAIMGNLNNLIEAHSGEFIKKRNMAKGLKLYAQHIPDFLADRNKVSGKHWFTKMVEDFDLLHGEYINSFGENVSGNRLKKELTTSNLMVLQTSAEHEINISMGLAFMDSMKWIDGKFIDRVEFRDSGGDMKIFDSSKSLLDFMMEGEGKLSGEQREAWTKKDRETLKHRTHEVQKYVHGNYAAEDKMGLQRKWYGKLAAMFKKYVVPGFARRYGRQRFNHATGTVMEGYYRSAGVAIYDFFKGVMEEMNTVGVMEALNHQYRNLTPVQKANMRRVVAEGAILFSVLAIVAALTPDDDEDNTYWENVNLLIARRMQSEIMFYMNIKETWRIIRTPAVSMNTVESFADFAGGLLFQYGEDEVYQRDTGFWKKGDSKDLARATKLIPLVKGVLVGITPDEQLKAFNR